MDKLPVNPVGLFADDERLLYNILRTLERIEAKLAPAEEPKSVEPPAPTAEQKKQTAPKTVKKGANTNAENVGRTKTRKS